MRKIGNNRSEETMEREMEAERGVREEGEVEERRVERS